MILIASPLFAGGDFCAATVFVKDGSGNPAQTIVRLIDPSSMVVESHETSNGSAEFCDFGFGVYKIQIGEKCGLVTIWNVEFEWGARPQLFGHL